MARSANDLRDALAEDAAAEAKAAEEATKLASADEAASHSADSLRNAFAAVDAALAATGGALEEAIGLLDRLSGAETEAAAAARVMAVEADDAADDAVMAFEAAVKAVQDYERGLIGLDAAMATVAKAMGEVRNAATLEAEALNLAREAAAEAGAAAAGAAEATGSASRAFTEEATAARAAADAVHDLAGAEMDEVAAAMAEAAAWRGSAANINDVIKADRDLGEALKAADLIGAADDAARYAESLERLATEADRVKSGLGDMRAAFSASDQALADLAKGATAATGFWARWGNVIHWVAAGLVEFSAVAIPALVAFGGAMLVGMQGAQMLQEHLTALWTAAEATGNVFGQTMGTLLGLKSVLQQAQDAANPHIYALLGAGLGIVKEQAGGLVQAGSQVILVFDRFAARLQYDFSKAGGAGQTMGALLKAMVPDLVEFGQVFGNIGHAIANLASKMPGLAEVLLKLLDAFSRILLWVSKLPAPLIMTAMAMEEIWRWGQPLVAILTRIPTLIEGFIASGAGLIPVAARIGEIFRALVGIVPNLVADLSDLVAGLAVGSRFEAAANGARDFATGIAGGIMEMTKFQALIGASLLGAIVGVGIALDRTRSSTQQFTDSFNRMLASAKNVNVMTYIATDFQTATDRISQQTQVLNRYSGSVDYVASTNAKWTAQLRNLEGPLAGAGQGAQNLNDKINILAGKALAAIPGMEGLGHAYAGLFTAEHAASAVQQLTTAQQMQVNAMKNVSSGMAYLQEHYHLTAQGALALADAAGVKLASGLTGASEAAVINRTMIEDLYRGYLAMGQPASEVGTDMTALAIQSGLAASKVSQLNQAWDQFMQGLVGGTAGLAGLNIGIQNMGQVVANASQNLSKYTGSMNVNVTAFAQSLKSFSGQGAAAWQQFDQVVGQTAPQLIDWLRQAGQEGALGANGQEKFTRAVADISAKLVGFASASKPAQAELMGLASAADHNITSWPQFVKWVDKSKGSAGDLGKIISGATGQLENMGQVAQKLGDVMNNDLAKMMDAVKLKAYGVQDAFQALGNQLAQAHPDTQKVASAFQSLLSTLSRVFGPSQARQMVNTFVHQFGDTIKNGMVVPIANAKDGGNKTARGVAAGLDSGKGSVATAAEGIFHSITGILHPLPGQLQTTGSQASTGLHSGLEGGMGPIRAWPGQAKSAITGPMAGIQSVLESLGVGAADGLARGLASGIGAIASAASALAHAIPSTVARLLSSASPSKVMMQQGQFAVDGLVKGLTGGIPQIKAAIKKIMDEVHKTLYAGLTGWEWAKAKIADPFLQMIEGDNRRLQVLANERSRIVKEIKAAEQFAKSTASSLIGATGLAGLTQPTDPKTGNTLPWTVGNIQSQMGTQLNQLKAFDHNIDVLKKMGLNKTLLNQIIAAGYQQGGALAQALAHGSESQIKSLNATEEAIIKASKKIGKDAANAMYDTGKNAGKGFLSGLKSQEAAIEKLMEKIAKDMIKALKRALKIKSPSQEMHDAGMFAAQGLAQGLLAGEPMVLAAAKKLAAAVGGVKIGLPVPPVVHPGGPVIQVGTLPPAGVSQPLTIVHQHIAGSVLSEQQLQQYVQTAQLKYTRRNLGNGLFLQGRASGTPAR